MKGNSFLKSIKIFAILILAGLSSSSAFAQTRSISGTVVDSQNVPIIGASVMVVGQSTVGTVTDLDGRFSLNVPAGSSISVSFIGYETQTIAVGNQSVINVQLAEDAEFLEETVVIGYGVQRKSDITGAIASVKESDLANRTTTNAVQALQGKAAGVQIVNFSGAPGSDSNIQIRGYSSNSSTRPLIIVDGLKVNSMNYLDPENIQSIEVLKDAASAAIYGVEAGNGVILITTKSGASEKGTSRVFYNFQQTSQKVSHLPELLNAKEYMEYQMLAGEVSSAEAFDYDGHTDTYWPGLMFETGYMRRHTVGFQGGNDRGSLYISLNSLTNDGVILGDKDYNSRLSAQINAEYKMKDWLTVGINNSFTKGVQRSVSESGQSGTTVMGTILVYDPITPWSYPAGTLPARLQLYIDSGYALPQDPATGEYYGASVFGGNNLLWHPAIMRDRSDTQTDSFNINGTAYLNLAPIKGLVFTSRLGYRVGQSMRHGYNYEIFVNPTESQAFSISANASQSLYYQWENFANYTFNIAKNSFTVMAGMSFQKNTSDGLNASADQLSNYAPNYRYMSNAINTSKMSVGGTPGESSNMSYYGRISWSYANRYNFQANFRADAYDTSKLDKDHRWGYFPSVSAGWTISNEPWMSDFVHNSGISQIRLRASWGINGNVNSLGSYQYASTLSTSVGNGYDFGNGMVQGASPSTTLPNPNIKWETSNQVDVGFDLRAFRDRLSLGIDWYNKNTENLLTTVTPPANTGASRVYMNAGRVNNTGLEFEASWRSTIGDFRYSISGNAATLKNKVVKGTGERVPGTGRYNADVTMTYFEEGYPLWYLRTFIVEGIDQQTGAPIYKDFDGKPGITADDRDYAGKGIPDLTYGVTIELGWKNFDLLVMGSGVQGIDKFFSLSRGDTFSMNTLREFYTKAWQSPSSTGYIYPKPDAYDTFFPSSNMRVYDASFFKIKQLQLGYTVPRSILRHVLLSNLRVYASLDDWFTFTKYPGLDPETSAAGNSANAIAVDWGSYPMSKKVVFGVNVSF